MHLLCDDETLDAWDFGSEYGAEGASSTAKCEEAMPPSFLPDDLKWVSRRGMLALIDNSIALSGLVKRQRRGAAAARAVQPVNMPRYH